MQLTELTKKVEARGLIIVTITYHSVATLKSVEEDQDITFTLLHDENVKHVNAFGIRNMDYEPGNRVYGIPYPGIFLVDTDGIIKYKFSEESYRERPDFEDVLKAAAQM